MIHKYALIVAGGSGTRMGGEVPKQFRDLNGMPVLWWSLKAFHESDPATHITVVIPKDQIPYWTYYRSTLPLSDQIEHAIVEGGNSRSESVKNGFSHIVKNIKENNLELADCLIAVHDGARPLVTKEIIREGWSAAEKNGAAVPAVPVNDSLRELSGNHNSAVDRSRFVAVQTPQVFKVNVLHEAYSKASGKVYTDDASVVESAGYDIQIFRGSPENLKVTYPMDLILAKALFNKDV